jgi:hypothetical protein
MFSVIPNIYNKEQRTYLNGMVHSYRKSEKVFLTTRDVRCVHHGWHGTHTYCIQVLATRASTWMQRYSSLVQRSVPKGADRCARGWVDPRAIVIVLRVEFVRYYPRFYSRLIACSASRRVHSVCQSSPRGWFISFSFNFQYSLISFRSSSSCLLLLSHHPVTYIFPSIFSLKARFERVSTQDVGHAVAQLVKALRYKPGSRGYDSRWCTGIFHWHNPSGRTMTLGMSQPLTEMNTRNIFCGGKDGRWV